MGERIYFGTHWFQVEKDDVILFKFIGAIDEEDSRQARRLVQPVIDSGSHFYILCDVSELGAMSPAARKMAAEWYVLPNILGTASFGGSAILPRSRPRPAHGLRPCGTGLALDSTWPALSSQPGGSPPWGAAWRRSTIYVGTADARRLASQTRASASVAQ